MIALSVAAVLAVFLLYTSLAGGAKPALQPSELASHSGSVVLGGTVVGPVTGDARGDGLNFTMRDVKGTETVAVVYTGSVPDLFRTGREVMLEGSLGRRHVRRRAGLDEDEVPVEVHAGRVTPPWRF